MAALEVPAVDDGVFAGAILDHIKAPDRVPPSRGLVSLFASPYASPDLLQRSDDEVVPTDRAPAERFLPGLTGATRTAFVVRRPIGLPRRRPRPRCACDGRSWSVQCAASTTPVTG